MKSVPPNIGTAADRRSLDDIDSLLDELSRLARTETSADSFYAQLLETATVAIGAVAAAVWLPVPGRKLAPLRKFRLETAYDESRHRAVETESDRYATVITSGQAASFPAEPHRGVSCAVLACPLKDSTGTKGVLTIYLPAETPALARKTARFRPGSCRNCAGTRVEPAGRSSRRDGSAGPASRAIFPPRTPALGTDRYGIRVGQRGATLDWL